MRDEMSLPRLGGRRALLAEVNSRLDGVEKNDLISRYDVEPDRVTVVSRRAKKDPADKGGWSAFHTYAIAADILNPIAANFTVANGDKAWFGWPNDPEMEKLRDAYAKETDPAKAKALAAAVQNR